MRTSVLNFLLLITSACHSAPASSADATTSPDAEASPDAAPETPRIVLGVYSDSFQDLDATVLAATGRHFAIENQRELWTSMFDHPDEAYDQANGVIPMLSWVVTLQGSGCAKYEDIMAGVYDAQLTAQAHTLAMWNKPVAIRFFKEFTDTAIDDCFFPGGHVAARRETTGPMFVNTWQHVVDVFKAAGASNVQWVWGPAASLFGNDGVDQTTWHYFYPGNNYVDWISNDHYNKYDDMAFAYGANDHSIENWYNEASQTGKPLMQAETGAGYHDGPVDPMAQWLATAATTVKARPAMKAFLWWSSQGQVDYNLQGDGLTIFESMMKDPVFTATDVTPYATSTGAAGGPAAPQPHGVASTGSITLHWQAPADAHGSVTGYTVYRDGVWIGATTDPKYVDSDVTANTTYRYTVDALDDAWNRSVRSAEVAIAAM